LGDIPGTLNLESGRGTGRGSGRKFVRDVLPESKTQQDLSRAMYT
jgi:hypothetical protein